MSNVFGFRQPPPGFITEYHGGGGKGGTTTQSVSIPPEVLARYNAVNARAEDTAKQPFQPYGGQFVAGLTPTQQAGQAATSAYSQAAQPYFGAATDLTLSGARDVGPLTQDQISYYQNPAMLATLAPTQAALQQQQGQQLAQQQAEAIRGGAFGGGRDKMQRDILRGQQQLGMGQALAPIYQQAYQTGLSTAQQQQGVVAQDLARRMQAGQQIAGLGTGAQQAALQGAQAQMAAGQVEQQTQQADLTARYQQFLQERGYPFQVAQFLANIAMGTGALSGSTTTTQQPGGFFSDKRLKKDVKEIGETHDGQPIYSYKYNGDDRTQIGLMAQDVEKKHPEAVGLMGGYKTVDYKKATEDAERTHKDMGGGLMPDGFDPNSMGGAVTSGMAGEGFMRGGYVGGGLVGNDDWAQILAANKQALGVYGGAQPMGGAIGAGGIVPQASVPVPKLITAGAAPQQKPAGLSTAMQTGQQIANIYKGGKETVADLGKAKDWLKDNIFAAHGGLIVPRHAYADGGMSEADEAIPYDPSDVMGGKDPMEGVLKSGEHKIEPLKPAQAPGGGGGGSGLGDVASIMGSAAKIIPFFFKEGGLVPRQGFDDGGPVDTGSLFSSLEKKYDLPEGYLNRTWQIESRGGKDLYNEGSGAAGHFQFIPGTQKMMGLQNPYDLSESADATARLAAQNRETLRKGGIDNPTAAQLYLAHQQGGLGATRLLNAADRPAGLVVGEKAVTGNRGDPSATGLTFANKIMNMYEGTQGPASGPIPAAIPRSQMSMGEAASRMTGEDASKGIGDTLTSERFLVPALGFLGSMLASNRPNFGQALGEGIMGGVGAYQQQKKMTADLAKGVLDIVKDRFHITNDPKTGQTVYFNKATGTPITAGQYAQAVGGIADSLGVPRGVLGIPTTGIDLPSFSGGPTKPGEFSRPGVAGKPSDQPAAAEKPTEDNVSRKVVDSNVPEDIRKMSQTQLMEYARKNKEKYGLVGDRDPEVMQAQINEYRRNAASARMAGNTSEASDNDKLAQDSQARMDTYLRDAVKFDALNNEELVKYNTQSSGKYMDDVTARMTSYNKDRQSLVRLADIYSRYEPGRAAEIKAEIGQWANEFGVKLPEKFDAAPVDEAIKLATANAINLASISQLGRAPKALLESELKTVASPKLAAGAVYSILGRTIGEMDYNNARDRAYAEAGVGTEVPKFISQFQAKERPETYIGKAFSEIPVTRGVDRKYVDGLAKTYNFTPKSESVQQQAPPTAAPVQSIPDPIRELPGLVYSPSRNQYRDAQGNIYDASGKRVQ